ncbi:PadR family transcriptional regulator [Nonomuraea bangladeshensis]|uniref:PadR family transcriptional regulator n=1 Tax=Nonomuraea bangladeshensis TaxID=404385 RepID=UPI0031D5E551
MEKLRRVGKATLDVLEALANAEEDQHGFGLAKQIGRPTGSIYPALSRLEEAGWLESYWAEPAPEGRPRRRLYRLTEEGRQAAHELLGERRNIAARKSVNRRFVPALPGLVES